VVIYLFLAENPHFTITKLLFSEVISLGNKAQNRENLPVKKKPPKMKTCSKVVLFTFPPFFILQSHVIILSYSLPFLLW
jgi:hypothetical protein